MKLEELFKTLGIPLALILVVTGLLAWAGLDINQVVAIAESLIGFQLMGFILIDSLKYAGVIKPGDAGKWSAVYNLITIAGVAFALGFAPDFSFAGIDEQVYKLAEVLGVLLAYVTQLTGTKGWHVVASSRGLTYSFPK